MNPTTKLLSIAGPAVSHLPPQLSTEDLELAGSGGVALFELLKGKNGFLAFESALHVRPADPADGGLSWWNQWALWKYLYGDTVPRGFFFAEDIFGGQFLLRSGNVERFDPETGESSVIAGSVDEWAVAVLDDAAFLTGWPLGHEWQSRHGPIDRTERLVPKRPFSLGGAFHADNLVRLPSVRAMRTYAGFAVQVQGKADQTRLRFDTHE